MFYGQFVSHAHVKCVGCLMFFGDSESNQAAKDKVCTQWSSLVQSNPASRRSSPQCLNNVSQDVSTQAQKHYEAFTRTTYQASTRKKHEKNNLFPNLFSPSFSTTDLM